MATESSRGERTEIVEMHMIWVWYEQENDKNVSQSLI